MSESAEEPALSNDYSYMGRRHKIYSEGTTSFAMNFDNNNGNIDSRLQRALPEDDRNIKVANLDLVGYCNSLLAMEIGTKA